MEDDLVRYVRDAIEGEALLPLTAAAPCMARVCSGREQRKLTRAGVGPDGQWGYEDVTIVGQAEVGDAVVVAAHLAGRVWVMRAEWREVSETMSIVEVTRWCAEPAEGVAHHGKMITSQAYDSARLRSVSIIGTATARLLVSAWRDVVRREAGRLGALVPDGWGASAERWRDHLRRMDPYGRAPSQLWLLLDLAPPAHRVAPLAGGGARVEWVRAGGRESLTVDWDGLAWVGVRGWVSCGVDSAAAADYVAAWVDGRENCWVGGGR